MPFYCVVYYGGRSVCAYATPATRTHADSASVVKQPPTHATRVSAGCMRAFYYIVIVNRESCKFVYAMCGMYTLSVGIGTFAQFTCAL